MKCLGFTKGNWRCSRPARFLVCRDHVRQPFLALGFVVALAGGIVALVDRAGEKVAARTAAPKTLDECRAEATKRDQFSEIAVDTWYCETEFTNIWARQPTMLRENKKYVLQHFAYLDPTRARGKQGFTADAKADHFGLSEGARLSRVFTYFPRYQDRFALVTGRVNRLVNLTREQTWSEWVVQLGSVREESSEIYAHFTKPIGWKPPRGKKCFLGLIEGVPIARGPVRAANTPGELDVVYELAAKFECFRPVDTKGFAREHPDLARYLRRGMDGSRW